MQRKEESKIGEEVEDEERLNLILQMDAQALMITLKELEDKLTTANDPTLVPAWARSVIPRLESVESKLTKAIKNKSKHTDNSSSAGSESDGDHAIEKLTKDFASKVDITKITFGSQVAALSLEVDRLQKLLQIRPTISEMQKIMFAVSQYKREIEKTIADMTMSVSLLVKDKVSEEMMSIMERLKKSDTTTEKGLSIVLKNVEEFGHEVDHIKHGLEVAHQGIQDSQDNMRVIFTGFDAKFDSIEADISKRDEIYQASFVDIRDAQSIADENFNEHREETNSRLNQLELASDKLDNFITSVDELSETKDDEQREKNSHLTDRVTDFRKQYEEEIGEVRLDTGKLFKKAEEHAEIIAEHGEYIQRLKNMNIIEKVNVNQGNITLIQQKCADFDERLTTQHTKIKKLEKLTHRVHEEMEVFPAHVKSQAERMDQIQTFLDSSTIEMERMRLAFDGTVFQVSELFKMSEDVQLVKELGAQQDQRVRAVQASLDSIMDGADEHDRILEDLQEKLKSYQSSNMSKIEECKAAVLDVNQQELTKLEAMLENFNENLSIIDSSHREMKAAKENNASLSISIADPAISVSVGGPVSASHIEMVADQCLNYEGIAMRLTAVPDIPESICDQLSHIAMAVASLIATQVDQEAVRSLLKGTAGDDVTPESLTDKSQRLMDNFIEDVQKVVVTEQSQPGVVRQEARDKFFAQFRRALQTFMSKHDQVLIVGGSRYGNIKIPTCIACDRPLLNKVREFNSKEDIRIPREATGGVKPFHKLPKPTALIEDESPPSSKPGTGALTSKEPLSHRPLVSTKQMSQTAHIMKSGFKMPKPNSDLQPEEMTLGATMSSGRLPEIH